MQWQGDQGPAFPNGAQTHCDFRSLPMKPEQKLLDSLMENIFSMPNCVAYTSIPFPILFAVCRKISASKSLAKTTCTG